MSNQDDCKTVVDREAAQQADELPRLRPGVLLAAEYVGEGVEDDDAGLSLSTRRTRPRNTLVAVTSPVLFSAIPMTASRPASGTECSRAISDSETSRLVAMAAMRRWSSSSSSSAQTNNNVHSPTV